MSKVLAVANALLIAGCEVDTLTEQFSQSGRATPPGDVPQTHRHIDSRSSNGGQAGFFAPHATREQRACPLADSVFQHKVYFCTLCR